MKMRYLLSLLFTAVVLIASATERPAAKMRQAALKTLNNTNAKSVLSKPTLEVYSDGTRFSIVSRDDRFPEVLAYGCGNFDMEQAPDNVKWWFDRIQHSMEQATKDVAPRFSDRRYVPIAPMMETKWGQGSPYNDLAPTIGNEHAPTGCVATAMAQMMNYQQYPASAQFAGHYSIGKTPYTENISDNYSWPYLLAYGAYLPTADAEVAVINYNIMQGRNIARLMRDCGYAVDMTYELDGSGAMTYMAGKAFVENFGYPLESVKYLMREYYTDDEWMDILYGELLNNSPVLYAGHSESSGGHAFVLHGMDAQGLAFVNWGWQGQFDGYYSIDLLNPSNYDFSEGEEMVVGVRPTPISTDVIQSCFATDAPYKFSYDNQTKKLTMTFPEPFYNVACRDFAGRLCLVVEDMNNADDTEYIDVKDEDDIIEPFWGYSAQSISGTFGFDPGVYRLYFATLDAGEPNWTYLRTIGGAFYYDMTVASDGTVTIANAPTFTTASGPISTAIHEIEMYQQPSASSSDARYYDLQGHEVGSDARGLIIVKQGGTVRKIFR